MTSRRKSSSKSRRGRSVPDGSSLQHENIAPKVEFSDHSIDPEEIDAYWTASGEPKNPTHGTWRTAPFRANPMEGCPSRSCPNGLDAIRSFCKFMESVEFRLPVAGEFAESPPNGYFTCFEGSVGSNRAVYNTLSDKGPEFTKASSLVNGGLLVMNRALDASNKEACMDHSRRGEGGLVATEILHAYK
ncbi:hypothetical protein F2Q68_00016895 [Brassica cretica]|uniref:Uncharacterized protein n=1 Tax=Brassica cretica TaxID=69181 RepID=A0A8S9HMX0_BRACR|nr:hypothetical protein F2Q68_00016895 [Brassica cretica]